ncbi:MAG: fatty acid desaturase [Myxococcales bacterium]|nr:fatty acid desaturase [Myxococcales bacterium]
MTIKSRTLTDDLSRSPFVVSESGEPHRIRRKQIIKEHPEIRQLFGYDRRTIAITVGVVVAQFALAWGHAVAARSGSWFGSWWMIALSAYFVGSILSHWAGQTIHETSHNLAAKKALTNRLLALFANLPMVLPIAETFRRYHLDHHTFLGVHGADTDLPLEREVELIGSSTWRKLVWLLFYFFVYVGRGWTFVKGANRGEVLNFLLQMAVNVAIYYLMGWSGLVFLLLSTIIGHSLHPVAAHFIHEHYTFEEGQETNSYYGPLNKVTFNVGYHVEHHDFMNVPGSRLPELKALAAEYYDDLRSHRSWTAVLWQFVTDRTLGVFSRIVRSRKTFDERRRDKGTALVGQPLTT